MAEGSFGYVDRFKQHLYRCMSNVAEGFVRHSDKEFVQFLFIAMSSAAETQSHAYVALDQKVSLPREF